MPIGCAAHVGRSLAPAVCEQVRLEILLLELRRVAQRRGRHKQRGLARARGVPPARHRDDPANVKRTGKMFFVSKNNYQQNIKSKNK